MPAFLNFPRASAWDLRERTRLLGILNVTPDSFFDGGRFDDPGAACAQAARLVAEGADGIDIGGESTRPGSAPVPLDVQRERVLPALRRIRRDHPSTALSVDTTLSALAIEAFDEGADMINDITALRGRNDRGGPVDDGAMGRTIAAAGGAVILMHMRGTPATMQDDPRYGDVASEIGKFLREAIGRAAACGIARDRIVIDPGIGFGKTAGQNLTLIARLGEIGRAARGGEDGPPILVGASRKGFIGALTGDGPGERLPGTLGAAAVAILRGASILRVHDIGATARLARVVDALVRA